ncbi:hypothetical protein F4778DRAFT_755821 [Xylariomycetidae sp. FL2044]|nr:hypothetical protein F4778DRAFT_755821 [Xylariomycetidae sp. FL2044]
MMKMMKKKNKNKKNRAAEHHQERLAALLRLLRELACALVNKKRSAKPEALPLPLDQSQKSNNEKKKKETSSSSPLPYRSIMKKRKRCHVCFACLRLSLEVGHATDIDRLYEEHRAAAHRAFEETVAAVGADRIDFHPPGRVPLETQHVPPVYMHVNQEYDGGGGGVVDVGEEHQPLVLTTEALEATEPMGSRDTYDSEVFT